LIGSDVVKSQMLNKDDEILTAVITLEKISFCFERYACYKLQLTKNSKKGNLQEEAATGRINYLVVLYHHCEHFEMSRSGVKILMQATLYLRMIEVLLKHQWKDREAPTKFWKLH
jgi:hypothetical protein